MADTGEGRGLPRDRPAAGRPSRPGRVPPTNASIGRRSSNGRRWASSRRRLHRRRVHPPREPRRHRDAPDRRGGHVRSSPTRPPTSGRGWSIACSIGPSTRRNFAIKWADILRNKRDGKPEYAGEHLPVPRLDPREPGAERPVRPVRAEHPHGHRHARDVAAGDVVSQEEEDATNTSTTRRRSSWGCGSSAPSATTTRSRSGGRTITTASPRSSPGWGGRTGSMPTRTASRKRSSSRPGPARSRTRRRARPWPRRGWAAAWCRFAPSDDPRQKLVDWMADAEESRTSPGRWSIATGPTSSAGGSSSRWTTSGSTNPPSNPELLDALAESFVKSGYDLKGLVR